MSGGSKTRLADVAKVIRSKNAGPLLLTIDVIFDDRGTYERVIASGILSAEVFAGLYGVSHNEVAVIPYAQALAIKITLPRLHRSGGPADTDVYGAQQHAPVMDLEF